MTVCKAIGIHKLFVFLYVTPRKMIAENAVEYCHKGDLLGVKGRIQSRKIELDEQTKREIVEVVAEKVTYLSSKRADE